MLGEEKYERNKVENDRESEWIERERIKFSPVSLHLALLNVIIFIHMTL